MDDDLRSLLAKFAVHGPRPFLMWSLTLALAALGFAFVYRFAMGSITPADFMALIPIVAPLMQQLYQRHVEVSNDPSRNGLGLGMGPGAALGAS